MEKAARGLQLALLVELQQLVRFRLQRAEKVCSWTHSWQYLVQDTTVAQLLGEALLATDRRHCTALHAALTRTSNQAIAPFLR